MIKKFIKNFLIINVVIILVAGTSLSAFSHEMSENSKDPLPSSYISEAVYYELKTKGQIINGPCGAFASIAALEFYLAKNNIFEEYLSEKHLLTWMKRGDGNIGWNHDINNGLSPSQICSYFMSGEGPVLEKELPYNTDDTVFDESVHNITPKYSVKGIKLLCGKEEVKRAIMQYGAVCGLMKVQEGMNHLTCIVGWDDDKNLWIVKDSGIDNEGDAGGFYGELPYDFEFICHMMFTDVKKYNENEKVYQHDKFNIHGCLRLGSKFDTVANVFNFDGDETLDTVILGILSESNIDYEIYFVPVEETLKTDKDERNWVSLKKGTIEKYYGYMPIELDNKINLKNQKGSIVLKVNIKDSDPDSCLWIFEQIRIDGLNLPVQKDISYFYDIDDDGNYGFYDPSELDETFHSFSIKAVTVKNK